MKKIILLLVLLIFISGCAEQKCEIDADCSAKDCFEVQCKDYKCIHFPVSDCCGNDKCEQEETYESCSDDCLNCNDSNKLTADSFNYATQKCENIVTHYFIDDFEEGTQNWNFRQSTAAWSTVIEDGNTFLRGTGHNWAGLEGKEWTNYIFKGRFKLIQGLIKFFYRFSEGDTFTSYGLIIQRKNSQVLMNLCKSIAATTHICELGGVKHIHLDKSWHAFEIRGYDNVLKIYIDDKLLIEYKDSENPLLSGAVAFGSFDNWSEFLIDDVEIKAISEKEVEEEVNCPYECCENEIYNPKTCAAGSICYKNKCYSKDEGIEILKDTKFEWGFTDVGASSLPDDTRCEMPIQGKKPVWAIAEIATETHFCKNLPNPKSTEPIVFESENGYKKLYSYKDGRIKLQLDSSAEEKQGCGITNPMDSLTTWIDYGVRQHMLIDFADFEELNFNVDVKLNKFEFNIPKQKCSEYGSIVDRYGEFLIVFLLRRKGGGGAPDELFWLLLPTCQKHWWPGAYSRLGSEHKECNSNSREFIMNDQYGIAMYHPAMNTSISTILSRRPAEPATGKHPILKDDEWVNYNFDLKELAEDGIRYYNSEYDPDINLYDYYLAHVAFDWEIVGGFDTDIELKDLSLKGKLVSK